MKNSLLFMLLPLALLLSAGQQPMGVEDQKPIRRVSQVTVDTLISNMVKQYGETVKTRLDRGIRQCAGLWSPTDGSDAEFAAFCRQSFVADEAKRDLLFKRFSTNFESLFGHFNMVSLDLKRAMHLEIGEMLDIDQTFAAYEPSSHLSDDFFDNKLAFVSILNFPSYTLQEKEALGAGWTRTDWAYARLGDMFTARVPAKVSAGIAEATTAADNYISNYNIYMGNLLDDQKQTHFPAKMKLITHWNLRDELKANYNKTPEGLFKQKMIYQVMLRIINQDIPQMVIDNPDVQWNPFTNQVFRNGTATPAVAEPDTRYGYLLDNFLKMKEMDPYTPMTPTYIRRAFDGGMEIPREQVEKLFTDLCSSPQVKKVAALIAARLGRPLMPFDIWYDGFKPRSNMNMEMLDRTTRSKYPDTKAFEADIPNMLIRLGFKPGMAGEIASHITVDPARGSGHAWGAMMKGDKAHLRTRISKEGMDYKGYNIAVHELGHNVEQTISLYMVDNYMMQGVPNTAFTEALAFTFQKRDLELLGIPDNDPGKEAMAALDNFWASYEIMGVSLVDMRVWEWLYQHPSATKKELKETVTRLAREVWNQYYAPVLGEKDSPILAIYSHMIDNPLYLSNYPVGHLIDFQLDRYLKGRNFADEIIRIYSTGKLIPQQWMKHAVGSEISVKPLLEATDAALAAMASKGDEKK